jgi:hypothetical protein
MSIALEIKMRRGRWTSSKVVNGTLESPLRTVVDNNPTDRRHLPLNQNLKVQRRRLIGPQRPRKRMSILEVGLEGVIHHPTEAGEGVEAEAGEAIMAPIVTLEHPQPLERSLTQKTVHPRLKLKWRTPWLQLYPCYRI